MSRHFISWAIGLVGVVFITVGTAAASSTHDPTGYDPGFTNMPDHFIVAFDIAWKTFAVIDEAISLPDRDDVASIIECAKPNVDRRVADEIHLVAAMADHRRLRWEAG